MKTAIILGGGVTGLSTAYHLARKKYGRVIVLEKGAIGEGSSSRAAGIITGLLWSKTGVLARKISLQLFRELSKELRGYKFQEAGCLNLFDSESWKEREKLLPLYDELEAPWELLSCSEMRERWPELHPDPSFVGLFDPLGGYSEPDDYIPALAAKVRELGVEIREGQKGARLAVRNGVVTGVSANNEVLEAEAVVSTVYAWTNQLLQEAGVHPPVKSFVHQRYVTKPFSGPVRIPAVNANPLYGYVRPAAGNRLLLGFETAKREEYRINSLEFCMSEVSAPAEIPAILKEKFASFLPMIEQSEWDFERVGLLTFSMDGEPMLGPVKALPGLYLGVAFHSGGFAYNPVSGMLLAEFVAEGKTCIDVTAFSPDRFLDAESRDYLAMTVTQENVVRRRH